MEFQEVVLSRRSIRSYKEGVKVTEAEMKEMIACAQQAPSWKNSQTGRYYVATSETAMAKIAAEALPEFNAANCRNASALIVTTFEKTRAGFTREGVAENELGDEWGAYDLGLQNALLVLKAREMGYDTLIMGIRDGAALRGILSIPDSQEVVAVIAVGKRVDDVAAPKRKPTEDVAKFF